MGRHLPWRALLVLPFLLGSGPLVAQEGSNSPVIYKPQEEEGSPSTFQSQMLPFDSDLWGPDLFQIPIEMDTRVTHFENLFLKDRRAWLETTLGRSWAYRSHILASLEEHQIPLELEYLPVVESSFVAGAYSRVGAAGLWQFMTNSIGPYNMKVDSWIDERRDFMKSTAGAAKKLRTNFQVTGDWNLALAAYNAGLGRISLIQRRTGIRDYWGLSQAGHLPKETAAYVPQFLAVTKVLSRKARNALPIVWDDPMDWKTLKLDRAVDLRILAQTSGVPLQDLSFGNRELKHNITPEASGGYLLKVPARYWEAVSSTLDDKKIPLLRYHIYKIKSGDTLSELADHYGTTVAMIQGHNGALNPRALRIGQEVLIPALKDVPPYAGRAPAKVASTAKAPAATGGNYQIQKGDTLWSLSRQHGTPVEELARINGISVQGLLKVGQLLTIPDYKEGNR